MKYLFPLLSGALSVCLGICVFGVVALTLKSAQGAMVDVVPYCEALVLLSGLGLLAVSGQWLLTACERLLRAAQQDKAERAAARQAGARARPSANLIDDCLDSSPQGKEGAPSFPQRRRA